MSWACTAPSGASWKKSSPRWSRGKLVLTGRDRYSLPIEAANRNLVVGRLTMHRDGYGFAIPESSELRAQLGGDIFISPAELGSAMHGDQVLVELKGRPGDGRTEGRILRITNRANATVVGIFHHGPRSHYVKPLDERVTGDVTIPRGMEWPAEVRDEAVERQQKITYRKPESTEDRIVGSEAAAASGTIWRAWSSRWKSLNGQPPHRARRAGSSRFLATKTTSAWMSRSSSANTIFPIAFPGSACPGTSD